VSFIQVDKAPCKDNDDYGVGVELASGSPMGKVVEGEMAGLPGGGRPFSGGTVWESLGQGDPR
jgi:hypothetical protein